VNAADPARAVLDKLHGVKGAGDVNEPVGSLTPNPLASTLTATIRELAEARMLHAAERDYLSWLQREVCRAREWTIIDVIRAWHEELDRREQARRGVRGDRRAA
jgi:hypothetical protein